MNDKVNESGQIKEYGPDNLLHAQPLNGVVDTGEPAAQQRVRRLLHLMGPTFALDQIAMVCESHARTVILNEAKTAFGDAAAHIHRAARLVDGYLIYNAPPDKREEAMAKVLGEVRACGIGKGATDSGVVVELFRNYRDTALKLNESSDKLREISKRSNDLVKTLKDAGIDTEMLALIGHGEFLSTANREALRKMLGQISEISAANLESLNANGIVVELLAILNDPAETCEVSAASVEALRGALLAHAKDTNPHDTATGYAVQAAEVITNLAKQLGRIADLNKRLDAVEESVASAVENPVPLDRISCHPVGCEAHFAGIRFHCHKTKAHSYEDRRQTFVTFEVYATTELDREALNALRRHAEAGTVAPLHAPAGCGIKGYGRLTSWPRSVPYSNEVTFQFELHATEEEGLSAGLRRFGNSNRIDPVPLSDGAVMLSGGPLEPGASEKLGAMLRGETVPRADGLYSALVSMMGLLWKARFNAEPTDENAATAAEFVNEHQATLEKLAEAFADPIDDDYLIVPLGAKDGAVAADTSATSPHAAAHANGFEPFVATPENDPSPTGPTDEQKEAVLELLRKGPMKIDADHPMSKITIDALKSLERFGLAKYTAYSDGSEGTWLLGSALYQFAQRVTAHEIEFPNAGAKAHASPFEGKPFDDTDPRNQVHALIAEHGSYGRPFGNSLSFNRDGLLVNDQPHALNEPFKLIVSLLELERAAPSDLKGYGFHDAGMLAPAASNVTRDHAAICLAYAGLLHDLRQALQRSLNSVATSARYNAEKSSDMLAYWTAELARMPVPAQPTLTTDS